MNDALQVLVQKLYALPALLIGFTVHECAHAATAVALGDDTPKLAGRYTLNPLRHIDPVGAIMALVFGFGWARPVVYNPSKLRKPVEHSVLISLAGPFANLVTAFACMAALKLADVAGAPAFLIELLVVCVQLNAMLFIFNLIPLPPLDGSQLVYWAIPEGRQGLRQAYFKYGYLALMAIVLLGYAAKVDILPLDRLIAGLIKLMAIPFRF